MENNPQNEPAQTNERPFEELANILGDRNMIKGEKEGFLEEMSDKIFVNYDFVSVKTYETIFKRLVSKEGHIALIGAGYPFDGDGYSNVATALGKIETPMHLMPVDILQRRAQSWLLIDENPKEEEKETSIISPVVADATQLPFPDNSISGYISANLINEPHKEEGELNFVRKMVGEAYRTLTPGGFIVLSSFGYFKYTKQNGEVTYNDYIEQENMILPEEVSGVLKEAGFSTIESLSIDHDLILEAIKKKKLQLSSQQREPSDKVVAVNLIDPCAYLAIK